MAGGLAIVVMTVITVFAFVWLIVTIDSILNWVANLFNRGSWLTKVLLLIPLLVLIVLSFMSGIIALILGLFALYTIATGARNWWHK